MERPTLIPDPNATPPRHSLDEKIVKKKSIPAQIVFWLGIVLFLFLIYKALSH
jgi:hypothetical protein